jgi:3-deoxy-7-phosphoheptulonate synthase
LVDPSHGTGRRELVLPLALAALAAGADGIIVEAHPNPDAALSDGAQSLTAPGLNDLMRELRRLAPLHGRRLPQVDGMSPAAQISDGRCRIDELDEALVTLLQERVHIARALGETKRNCGGPLRNTRREAEVLARVRQGSDDGLSAAALERIFKCIIDETLRAEEQHSA